MLAEKNDDDNARVDAGAGRFFFSSLPRKQKKARRGPRERGNQPFSPAFPSPIQLPDHALLLTGAASRTDQPADLKKRERKLTACVAATRPLPRLSPRAAAAAASALSPSSSPTSGSTAGFFVVVGKSSRLDDIGASAFTDLPPPKSALGDTPAQHRASGDPPASGVSRDASAGGVDATAEAAARDGC